ncbi:MAG: tetratricopeptide repeat protein, partial [Candidatus Kapabacteria bacterium]|nr:tetratricopeptide repeat protein [Candidatus Kapabacteria bacterium]
YEEGRYLQAAHLYAALLRSLPTHSEEWYTCQLHRAHCLRLAGSFRSALRLYRRLQQSTLNGADFYALDALVGEALSLRVLGQLRRARQLLEQVLPLYQARNDMEGLVHTLWALGTTLRFAGDFRNAADYLQQALQLHRQYRVGQSIYLYCALGGLSRMRGAVQSSLRYYQQAHKNAIREDNAFGIAYSACGIANAYRIFQNWSMAHHYFAVARIHYEHVGERLSYAYTLWGEAMAYLLQKQWDNAEALLRMAESLFRQTDRRGLLYVLLARLQIEALRSTPLPPELHRDFQQALHWSYRSGYRFESLHLQLLGNLLRLHSEPIPLAVLQRAYQECGSRWLHWIRPTALPINFP